RVGQEIVLGIAGVRALVADGFKFDTIDINEGHALPAAFELLRMYNGDLNQVRQRTVFTTHTPVAAGNEIHSAVLLNEAGFFAGTSVDRARELGNGEDFSLTVAALRMSRRANAVSQLHGLVANKMWEWVDGRCQIDAITNAVNSSYWQDERIKNAKNSENLLDAKREMKKEVFEYIEQTTGKKFNPDVLTITWARRFADYKRAWLILMDRERVARLLNEDKIQLIFSGKFHPDDVMGRDMFNNILEQSRILKNVVVLPNYELELSGKLKRCSDVWLNTPLRPFEASGTSGMSANMNGALHVSSYDGWAVEGTFDDINGYTVNYPGLDDDISWEERHWKDHDCVMNILENKIMPTYYNDKNEWARLMRQAIKTSTGYFDGDRMVIEYYNKMYNPIAHGGIKNTTDIKFEENPNLDATTFSNIK
ncbi:MAG: alpha-glucan family phosphorylase, partial [Candidatus Gastranaerophilales bacterium]|nr:alpha-glucan family phosphorylase [Candidatus Gastranaerophilales bacterium]